MTAIRPTMARSGMHPDDNFHAPPDDPWAYEAFWFSFFVPERKLMVYVYPWFRPTLGIAGGGVMAWDDHGKLAWNIVHCDYSFQTPAADLGAFAQGSALTLPQGVGIKILEPLRRYEVTYNHPNLALHVRFTAIHSANVNTSPIGGSKLFAGRIDQCGHVTGELSVGGQRYAVDCLSMRDRSWGIRRNDNHDLHIGYFHATATDQDAFLAVTNHVSGGMEPNDATAPVVSGYLMLGGEIHPLRAGTANLVRDAEGMPVACHIEAVDAKGRPLRASGSAINWFAFEPYSGLFNWSSLAEWRFNAHTCMGELQNTWHPDGWRAYVRRGR